jgi:gliding motility-associated-like protein
VNRIHIYWTFSGNEEIQPINLYKRVEGSTDWEVLSTLTPDQPEFTDDQNVTDQSSYDYFVGLVNDCDETLLTPVHRSIHVEGIADSTTNIISLSWNHYQGWPEGVGQYEIWRKLDDASGYRRITIVSGNENSISAPWTTDGFEHRYVVRAVENLGVNTSWSNQVSFEFEHPVYIPNIFTPNSDDKNHFFVIQNIHLYGNSVLTIVDRWGTEVMRVKGYQNNWDGDDASSGIYFYALRLDNGKKYKGMVTISR